MSDSNEPQIMTVKEVAALLRISRSAVYELAHSKQLAHLKLGTGRGAIRFKREDVDAYIRACHQEAVNGPRAISDGSPKRHGLREFKHLPSRAGHNLR